MYSESVNVAFWIKECHMNIFWISKYIHSQKFYIIWINKHQVNEIWISECQMNALWISECQIDILWISRYQWMFSKSANALFGVCERQTKNVHLLNQWMLCSVSLPNESLNAFWISDCHIHVQWIHSNYQFPRPNNSYADRHVWVHRHKIITMALGVDTSPAQEKYQNIIL